MKTEMKLMGSAKRSLRQGFTLIEILLVVAIIGMLVALVGVAVPKFLENARKDAAKAQIRMLDTAVNAYNMKNGKNPGSLDELKEFLTGGEIPTTPWQGEYSYASSSSTAGYTFEISCTAPDGTVIANTTLNKKSGANAP